MQQQCDVLEMTVLLRHMTIEALRAAGGKLVGQIIEYVLSEADGHRGVCFKTNRGDYYVHPEITISDHLAQWGVLRIVLRSDELLVLSENEDDCYLACVPHEVQYASVDSVVALAARIAHPGVCAREASCYGSMFAQLILRDAVLLHNRKGPQHEPELWCSACYDALRSEVSNRLLIDGRRIGLRTPIALMSSSP